MKTKDIEVELTKLRCRCFMLEVGMAKMTGETLPDDVLEEYGHALAFFAQEKEKFEAIEQEKEKMSEVEDKNGCTVCAS